MTAAAKRAEVIVIGGGQAGLTAGYYLAQAGIDFLILDAAPQAGQSWRQRWGLPGAVHPGPLFQPARPAVPRQPGHYPGKDEVAGYMQPYARAFDLPVRYNTRVTALERTEGATRWPPAPAATRRRR